MGQQIEPLQQELVDTTASKAVVCWKEHAERFTYYLKRIHRVRTINCLQDPTRGSTVSSHTQLMDIYL